MRKIVPVGDYVIVQLLPTPEVSEGGILLPSSHLWRSSTQGESMLVEGIITAANVGFPIGTRVLFESYATPQVAGSDPVTYILHKEDILAFYQDEE